MEESREEVRKGLEESISQLRPLVDGGADLVVKNTGAAIPVAQVANWLRMMEQVLACYPEQEPKEK